MWSRAELFAVIVKESGCTEVEKAKGIVISLSVKTGDLDTLLAENSNYANVPQVGLVTFPEVVSSETCLRLFVSM
jgi:hypothetical protein